MEDGQETQTHPEFGKDIYCPACGYNLYGAPGDKCPECGHSLASMRSPICQMPWEQRRMLGRFRAYWQTVTMVTSRNLAFCGEYAKSLSLADARVFRWVTVLHVYIPVLTVTIIVSAALAAQPPPPNPLVGVFPMDMFKPLPPLVDQACAEVWPVAIVAACLLLFLYAATGVPGYFFHPRSIAAQQQVNAVAMSYYACGPLAYSVISMPVLLALTDLAGSALPSPNALGTPFPPPYVSFTVCTVLAAAIPVIFWWWNLVRIARRTMPQLKYQAAIVGFCVPLLWLGIAVVILLLLPVAVLSILVAIVSFGH